MRYGMDIFRKRLAGGRRMGQCALLCLLLAGMAEAGVPVLSNQRITDVAPRSFSVILTVSEPSSAVLSLFAADCTTPVTGFTTALQQNQKSGNQRITIAGLTAATTYCYKLGVTSAATSDVATSASQPVTTATSVARTTKTGSVIIPTGNDILRTPDVFATSGETRDAILATIELLDNSAVSPLSLLLSVNQNGDYFNLNNLFATATGKSLDLVGGERVKFTEIHGVNGCIIERYRTIPPDAGGTAAHPFTRANPIDSNASGGVNILDVLRVVGGRGTTSSGTCFNSDLDLNGDGVIDGADLTIIKGGFNGLP